MPCPKQTRYSIERLSKVVVVAVFYGSCVQGHADAQGKVIRPGFGVEGALGGKGSV